MRAIVVVMSGLLAGSAVAWEEASGVDEAMVATVARRAGSVHGYHSSIPWLKRESILTAPTGEELVATEKLPTNWDWRHVNGRSFVTTDLNQHIPMYCGSCWIHGVVTTLNDRIKIHRGARFPDVLLARQVLLNCVPAADGGPPPGCDGGDAYMIHKYMHEHKVPDDSCMPYVAKNQECVAKNICRNCFHSNNFDPAHPFFTPGPCIAIKHFTGYGVGDYGPVAPNEVAMMKEIYARGPITCSAATDDSFVYNYTTNPGIVKNNVYVTDVQYTMAQMDHIMEVAGWGVAEDGMKYWVVRNSWGTYWGDMGWIKIRRGVNQQLIESQCDWAVPDVGDVEEELVARRVMGDYVLGVTWTGPDKPKKNAQSETGATKTHVKGEVLAGEPAAITAVSVDGQVAQASMGTVGAVLLAAGGGIILGAAVTHLAQRISGPRQLPLLG